MATHEEIISALQKRYAVKTFDPLKKVRDEDVHAILESARLSPSSFGLEPWKFFVITDPEMRKKIRAAGYDQTKLTEASHIIVIAHRTDADALVPELAARAAAINARTKEEIAAMEKMIGGAVAGMPSEARPAWLKSQTYIPLGVMVLAASLLGIDTCPMEGFDVQQINAILGLTEKHLSAATMLAIGYRGDDPAAKAPKIRRAYDEVVETI